MQLGVHLGWSYLRLDRLRLWFASDGRLASRFTWGTSSCRWWCLGWIEAGRGWCAWGELSRKRLKSGLVCVFFFFFGGGGQGWRLNKVGLQKQRRCSRHLFDLFLFTISTGYIIYIILNMFLLEYSSVHCILFPSGFFFSVLCSGAWTLQILHEGLFSSKQPSFGFITPLKINMEHHHGGLEDHVPFWMRDLRWFVGFMLIFQGVQYLGPRNLPGFLKSVGYD